MMGCRFMEVSEITGQQLKIAWERLDAAKYLFDGGFYKDSVIEEGDTDG